MRRPALLIQLLEDLRDEIIESDAVVADDAYMRLFVGGDELETNRAETALLLHSADTIEQLFEALHEDECAVELHGVTLEQEIMNVLERLFVAVDEV